MTNICRFNIDMSVIALNMFEIFSLLEYIKQGNQNLLETTQDIEGQNNITETRQDKIESDLELISK